MVRITLELLRKRCEHNDGLIHNLEELSLHQDNIEEIENVDSWCRELKILYLQGNTIQKIENLNRLKNLEYLNLALNSIERIENLNGCESLRKLDLTANFIGDLTSVENLRGNCYLEELFLTGNPCASYDGYREYVVAALPHLKILDGEEVTRTERLKAMRNFMDIKASIIREQNVHKAKRDREKSENLVKLSGSSGDNVDSDAWGQLSWSPEYRRQMARHRDEKSSGAETDRAKFNKSLLSSKEEKRTVRLNDASGNVLNVNEARIEFSLVEDEENNQIVLDVPVYRYLDTSMIDVDIHPTYVKLVIKGKVLQIKLRSEVRSDRSSVQRSTTTGNLRLIMPMLKEKSQNHPATLRLDSLPGPSKQAEPHFPRLRRESLEVDPKVKATINLDVRNDPLGVNRASSKKTQISIERQLRENSPGFNDEAGVPPLA